ncbi:MAG TPA: hypothetical protein VN688_19010 [Gemmataceae bacterium]|nr:hypothetical protein [Gemmataceae bacterium]
MLMRYWQAAIVAAAVALTANTARAEAPPAQSACGDCCKEQGCCKNKPCGETSCPYILFGTAAKPDFVIQASGCKAEGCCKSGTCCKDKKCCTANECGKCAKECCKSKDCCQGKCGAGSGCCAVKSKKVKKRGAVTPIIVVVPMLMPSPAMPVCGPVDPAALMQLRQQYSGCGMPFPPPMPMLAPPGLPQPPMPSQSVGLPVPPPCYGYPPCGTAMCAPMPCPDAVLSKADRGVDSWLSLFEMAADLCHSPVPSMCLSALGLAADLYGQTWSGGMTLPSGHYLEHPPQYSSSPLPMPRELAAQEAAVSMILPPTVGTAYASARPTAIPCSVAESLPSPTPTAKVCITADWYGSALEMSINDDACLSSKKMTLTVGDRPLTLTTVDGQVRVRAGELSGKADCVCTNRKDSLILEGNAVLHLRKTGQQPEVVKAERIELNLATGSITLQSANTSSH